MNREQIANAATQFLTKLTQDETTRNKWIAAMFAGPPDIPRKDWPPSAWDAHRKLIQDALGLPQPPAFDDLEKMRDYAQQNLMPQLNQVQSLVGQQLERYCFNGVHF
jgi:hypothetical protein